MRTLLIVIVTLTLVGCHAPKPDLNIFGASKVPPHGTSTYKTKEEMADDEYYSPAAASPRTSERRDDGRLLAIDATLPENVNSGPVSREILSVRSTPRRQSVQGNPTGPAGIRSATRPTNQDDGFRSSPVRITRSSVDRASFSEDVDSDSTNRVPSSSEILRSSGGSRAESQVRFAGPDSSTSTSSSGPRPLGSRAMQATELTSGNRQGNRTSQGSDVSQGGWSER
jgi:hypothetical protein